MFFVMIVLDFKFIKIEFIVVFLVCLSFCGFTFSFAATV